MSAILPPSPVCLQLLRVNPESATLSPPTPHPDCELIKGRDQIHPFISSQGGKKEHNDFTYALTTFTLPASKADVRWFRILRCIIRTIKLFFKTELLESNQQSGRWSSLRQLGGPRLGCRNWGSCPRLCHKQPHVDRSSSSSLSVPICKPGRLNISCRD